jgi:catechol 2,3-dioxygenase-like lactoylglutathione lyase family enzyme
MPLHWFSVVVDCERPSILAEFWCDVLGYRVVHESDDVVGIAADAGSYPGIEFVRAESLQRGKSRLHIDLSPADQADEVTRLVGLGARPVDVGQPADVSWVVLADPEGNEFCVLASHASWEAAPEQA